MDRIVEQTALKRMHEARTKLLRDEPFYGHLAMNLILVAIPGVPVTATDGKYLCYNPEEVIEASLDSLCPVIERLLTSIILGHHERRGTRPMNRWNQACAYSANALLKRAGRTLPAGALYDPQYEELTAEQVYNRMPEPGEDEGDGGKKQPQQGDQKGQGGRGSGEGDKQDGAQGQQGQSGQGEKGQGRAPPGAILDANPEDDEASSGSWEGKVALAENTAKAAGNMPAELSREIQELLDPKEDWPQLLRQYMTATARDDYSWARPNRRFISQGLYMPEAYSEQMGTMVLAVDVSGSINQRLLERFVSELEEIFKEVSFEEVHVIAVNTKLTGSRQFSQGEEIDVSWLRGGGGTKFSPAFKYVEDKGVVPDVFIYFTDLLCTEALQEPGYPVLWAKVPSAKEHEGYLNKSGVGEILELSLEK